MKKSLVAILIVSLLVVFAGTALAFPIDFNGDFRLQGRSVDDKIVGTSDPNFKGSWWQFRGRLNFSGKVDEDTTFFGRFTTRNDFGGLNTSTTELDQYGVKLKAGDWAFSVGRQAVILGQGTILSTGSDAVGVDNKFDGVIAKTKAGDFDVTAIGGKTNSVCGPTAVEWYGLDAATKMGAVKVGAAYATAKPQTGVGNGVKYWAVNAEGKVDTVTLNAEYAKSDADTNNSAYFVSAAIPVDKDTFIAQYNNVQNNAVNAYNSGIGGVAYPFYGLGLTKGNTKYSGFTYVYAHPLTKAASLTAIYMDLKVDGHSGSDKEGALGVSWSF